MSDFLHFRHSVTGKVAKLPAQYGRLFKDVLTEVDPNEADCSDCGFKPDDEQPAPEDVVVDEPEVHILPLEEPAPRRSRRNASTSTDTVE